MKSIIIIALIAICLIPTSTMADWTGWGSGGSVGESTDTTNLSTRIDSLSTELDSDSATFRDDIDNLDARVDTIMVNKYNLSRPFYGRSQPRRLHHETTDLTTSQLMYTVAPTASYEASWIHSMWFNINSQDSNMTQVQEDSSIWYNEWLIINYNGAVAETVTCDEFGTGAWIPFCGLTGCYQWTTTVSSTEGYTNLSNGHYWQATVHKRTSGSKTISGVLHLRIGVTDSLKIWAKKQETLPANSAPPKFYGDIKWFDVADESQLHNMRTHVCYQSHAFYRVDCKEAFDFSKRQDGFLYMFAQGLSIGAIDIDDNSCWGAWPFEFSPVTPDANVEKILEENSYLYIDNEPFRGVLTTDMTIGDATIYFRPLNTNPTWTNAFNSNGGSGGKTWEAIHIYRPDALDSYGLFGLTMAQRNSDNSPLVLSPTDSSFFSISYDTTSVGGTARTNSIWQLEAQVQSETHDTARALLPAGCPVIMFDNAVTSISGVEDNFGGYYNGYPFTSLTLGNPACWVSQTRGVDSSYFAFADYEIWSDEIPGSFGKRFDDNISYWRAKYRVKSPYNRMDSLTSVWQTTAVIYTFGDEPTTPTYSVDTFYCHMDTNLVCTIDSSPLTTECWGHGASGYSIENDSYLAYARWDDDPGVAINRHVYLGYGMTSLSGEVIDTITWHPKVLDRKRDWVDTVAVSIWNINNKLYPAATEADYTALNKQPIGYYPLPVGVVDEYITVTLNADTAQTYAGDTLRLGCAMLNWSYRCKPSDLGSDKYAYIRAYSWHGAAPSYIRVVHHTP